MGWEIEGNDVGKNELEEISTGWGGFTPVVNSDYQASVIYYLESVGSIFCSHIRYPRIFVFQSSCKWSHVCQDLHVTQPLSFHDCPYRAAFALSMSCWGIHSVMPTIGSNLFPPSMIAAMINPSVSSQGTPHRQVTCNHTEGGQSCIIQSSRVQDISLMSTQKATTIRMNSYMNIMLTRRSR